MPSYQQQLKNLPKWRRYATWSLSALALIWVVVLVTHALNTVVTVLVLVVIIGVSYIIGPRSPFFKSR